MLGSRLSKEASHAKVLHNIAQAQSVPQGVFQTTDTLTVTGNLKASKKSSTVSAGRRTTSQPAVETGKLALPLPGLGGICERR